MIQFLPKGGLKGKKKAKKCGEMWQFKPHFTME